MNARPKPGTARSRPALVAFLGGLVLTLFTLVEPVSESLRGIDRRMGDRALFHGAGPPERQDLVFLGIDEESLTLQGLDPQLIESNRNLTRMAARFPWDRRVHADAIEKLLHSGARLVVLDLVLAEPSDPAADAALADVISRYPGRIILASVFTPLSVEGDGFMLVEPEFLRIGSPPAIGFVNFRPDDDGVIREVHYSSTLSYENNQATILGETRFPSLAGATLEALGKSPPVSAEPRFSTAGTKGAAGVYSPLSIRSLFIPDDWEKRYGSGHFFRDKIIVIGPAAARFQDNHQTPIGLLLGPQLHLQAVAAGLENDFVTRHLENPRSVFWLALAGSFAAAALMFLITRPLLVVAGSVAAIAICYATAFALARFDSTWIGLTPFASTLFFGSVSGQSYDLLRERLERGRLHRQFRRFVSRDVADSLVDNPSIYQLAATGRKRRVVVMFTDLRGFTSLSEQVPPEQLFSQLNEYLTSMVKIIFAHGGTLDKFIGDAILAHWGALEDGDDRQFASSAMAATEAMGATLAPLNASWKTRGLPELEMGIGLHIGDVLAGEIGSVQRTEFGVIGDAVNLASRLEGLTKTFTCPWLASGAFIAATGNEFRLRRIAKVRVSGRQEPVDLWTSALCEVSRVSFAQALEFFEAGDFEAAVERFEIYLKDFIQDRVAERLLEQTRQLGTLPPPEWTGILELSDK